MYAGVPSTVPSWVAAPASWERSCDRAIPKSRILSCPSPVTSRFSGFRSRWTIPFLWASASAPRSSLMRSATSSGGSGPWTSSRSASVLPREQLHHQEGAAVVVDPVVVNRHDPRVPHGVGCVPLAYEPPNGALVRGEPWMEDLDGDPLAVAVPRLVHRCHAPHPQQRFQLPPIREHAPHAPLGSPGDAAVHRARKGITPLRRRSWSGISRWGADRHGLIDECRCGRSAAHLHRAGARRPRRNASLPSQVLPRAGPSRQLRPRVGCRRRRASSTKSRELALCGGQLPRRAARRISA